jgi:hypothetical protein
MRILDLPDQILEYLRLFISRRPLLLSCSNSYDSTTFPRREFDFDIEIVYLDTIVDENNWKRFINTTKQLFTENINLKKKTLYITLSASWSSKYLNDEYYRFYVNSLIADTRKQLRLSFSKINVTNYSLFNNLNFITFFDLETSIIPFELLKDVKIISIESCHNLTTVRDLLHTHTLEILDCQNIETIENLPDLVELYLCDCGKLLNLDFLSFFSKLQAFRFTHCNSIASGYDKLKDLNELWIYGHDLPDYTMLSNIKRISIGSSDNLDDPAVLSSVRYLEMEDNILLTKIQNLSYLLELSIVGCEFFDEVVFSTLPSLKRLLIENCKSFKQFHINGNSIQLIVLRSCVNLKRIIFESNSVKRVIIREIRPIGDKIEGENGNDNNREKANEEAVLCSFLSGYRIPVVSTDCHSPIIVSPCRL